MKPVRSKLARYVAAMGVGVLWTGVFALPCAFATPDLYVGNFFGPGNEDVLRYNGTTGAFVSNFVPTGNTFPLGGPLGPTGTSMRAIPMPTPCSVITAAPGPSSLRLPVPSTMPLGSLLAPI
jgi:hypothetical protein